MKKKSILLASVLKPVNEPRMYEKMGLSLVKGGDFDVHIAGSNYLEKNTQIQINFHEIHSGTNTLFSRVYAWFAFIKLCRNIRPTIIVIATPELLLPSIFYKWLHGCKLVYDIQENYLLNILLHKRNHRYVKILLAKCVRVIESFSARNINHFILAEKCYQDELPFIQKSGYSIFENKFSFHKKLPDVREKPMHFIFSGTIHEATGVHQAVNFVKEIRKHEPLATLKITGKAQNKLVQYLTGLSKSLNWLVVNVSSKGISYENIIYDVLEAEYVIASYPITDQNRNKIPSKFYEAIALNKRVIARKNKFWEQKFDTANFLFIDFENFQGNDIYIQIPKLKRPLSSDENSFWKANEDNFILLIKNLDKP